MPTLQQTVMRLAALAMVVWSLTGQASASVIAFSSRDAFRAAIPGATSEGWDDFASGTVIPNGALVNGVVYDLADPTADFIVTAGGATVSPPNGLGRTDNPFGGEAFIPSDIVTFSFMFPAGISAFGVSFNTASGTPGAYTLTTNRGDIVSSVLDPFPGVSTGQFAGFLSSEPVSSVTVQTTTVGFQFGLDELMLAQGVPEPTSLTLLTLGVLGLVGARLVTFAATGRDRRRDTTHGR
jgi:hypothetical protein